MVQVELGNELETRLEQAAQSQGVSVTAYVQQLLESDLKRKTGAVTPEQREAVEALRTFAARHKFRLGPDLTLRDLIDEGRRR
jgi:hypothetical protein